MRTHTTARITLAALCASLCLLAAPTTHVLAEAAPAPLTCDGLHVTLSEDKTLYVFKATASGDTSTVTGYTFDFDDRQSYSVTFSSADNKDRRTATVTHAYQNAGSYLAKVQIDIRVGKKVDTVSSPHCQTAVSVPPPGTELPKTGAGSGLGIWALSVTSATLLHHLWTWRRIRKVAAR